MGIELILAISTIALKVYLVFLLYWGFTETLQLRRRWIKYFYLAGSLSYLAFVSTTSLDQFLANPINIVGLIGVLAILRILVYDLTSHKKEK